MTLFLSLVCHWYGEEKHECITAIAHAIPALEFLAMETKQQQRTIPDCPICETWSSKMLPVHDLINVCGAALPDYVRTHLEGVWAACCTLKAFELPCFERQVFEHEGWQTLREAAYKTLVAMESDVIKPLLVDFESN